MLSTSFRRVSKGLLAEKTPGVCLRAFFSSKNSSSGLDPAIADYLSDLNIETELHKGVIKTLKTLYGNDVGLSNIQSFGNDGLISLAEALRNENELGGASRPYRMVHFSIPHHSTEFDLKWKLGDSLLQVAQSQEGSELLSEYIEAACSGNASCCTCHVYIGEELFSKLPEPSEAELDMLDLAFEPRETSRLACQVALTDEILQSDVPLYIEVPGGVNNMWG